jgi:hypothetical protein
MFARSERTDQRRSALAVHRFALVALVLAAPIFACTKPAPRTMRVRLELAPSRADLARHTIFVIQRPPGQAYDGPALAMHTFDSPRYPFDLEIPHALDASGRAADVYLRFDQDGELWTRGADDLVLPVSGKKLEIGTIGGAPPPKSPQRIEGEVALAPSLAKAAPMTGVLWVFARTKPGALPSAVKRLDYPQFPMRFAIGPQDTMIEGAEWTGPYYLEARLDTDGDPLTRTAGDVETSTVVQVPIGDRDSELLLNVVTETKRPGESR